MTEHFQQDIQTLMPMILRRLGQPGIHYQGLSFIFSPSELRERLVQRRMLPVIEDLAYSCQLSAMTWEFIFLHELQLTMLNYTEMSSLTLKEACNDHIYIMEPHSLLKNRTLQY